MKAKTYRQKAAALRRVGFKISLGAKGAPGGDLARKKAAVTRAWGKVGSYLESGGHKFIQASRRGKEAFASRKTRTPGGFFQPVPAGVAPGKIRYKLQGGVLIQRVFDRETGQARTDRIVKLDVRQIAANGQDYVNEMTKAFTDTLGPGGKATFKLMVNGWDGQNPYTTKDLGKYLLEKFIPSMRKQGLTRKQVNDIFHLKMISYDERPEPGEPGEYEEDEDDEGF